MRLLSYFGDWPKILLLVGVPDRNKKTGKYPYPEEVEVI